MGYATFSGGSENYRQHRACIVRILDVSDFGDDTRPGDARSACICGWWGDGALDAVLEGVEDHLRTNRHGGSYRYRSGATIKMEPAHGQG